MSAPWLILAMGAGVYSLRVAGLLLPDIAVPPAWEQALGFVPVALLTAFVVSSLTGRPDGAPDRIVAIAGAAIVAYRTRQMWACIASGMAFYWLLRLY